MKQDKRLIDANALKEKLQDHHDFFVDGVGGFHYLTPKDKARVDEITHCIAEIVNAHTVDAVEIPCHCCDCYYLLNSKNSFGLYFFCGHQNGLKNLSNTEKNYCPWGKRRNDG